MFESISRRDFLRKSAYAAGALALPLTATVRAQTPYELAGSLKTITNDELINIGQAALKSCLKFGANYADVRITTGLFLTWQGGPKSVASVTPSERAALVGQPTLTRVARIGVRAWVNGHLGFSGNNLSADTGQIEALAKVAVERAKSLGVAGGKGTVLSAIPTIKSGHYQTPVKRDPFSVKLGEQEDYFQQAMEAFRDTSTHSLMHVYFDTEWKRNDEIFMSTDGSLAKQKICHGNHFALVRARTSYNRFSSINLPTEGIYGAGGYELIDNLPNKLASVAKRANSLINSLKTKPAEPGAYDVVFAPSAAAMLLAQTIGRPLEADRVLRKTGASKNYLSSYVTEANSDLGKLKVGSELLNVSANRTQPGFGATVGWDSEGVEGRSLPLIEQGVLTDLITDRSLATELSEGYKKTSLSQGSRGFSMDTGGRRPRVKVPNLALHPAKEDISQEDLIKKVRRGYYVESMYINPDQAGMNVQATGNLVREIRNGQLGDLVLNTSMPFNTPRFWANLKALGGESSVGMNYPQIDDRSWEVDSHITVTTPPILVKNVFVINANRRQERSRGGSRGQGNSENGNQRRGSNNAQIGSERGRG